MSPSSLCVSNRVSFVARPNSTCTPMTKRTMHPAVDPGITPGDGSRKEQKREGQNQAQQSKNANNSANESNNIAPTDTLGDDTTSKRKVSSRMESWPVCGKKWYNEKLKTHMICDWRLDPADPKCPKDHPNPKANLARLVVDRHDGVHIGHLNGSERECSDFEPMCGAGKTMGSACADGNTGVPPRAFMSKPRSGEGASAWKNWLSSYGEDVALVLLLVVLTLVVQAWTTGGVSDVPVSGRALLAQSETGDTLDSVKVLSASVGAHDLVDMSLATAEESFGFGTASFGSVAIVSISSLIGCALAARRCRCALPVW